MTPQKCGCNLDLEASESHNSQLFEAREYFVHIQYDYIKFCKDIMNDFLLKLKPNGDITRRAPSDPSRPCLIYFCLYEVLS